MVCVCKSLHIDMTSLMCVCATQTVADTKLSTSLILVPDPLPQNVLDSTQ